MKPDDARKAMEILTAQAKEAVIVKVLERIADALEALTKKRECARCATAPPTNSRTYLCEACMEELNQ